MFLETKTMKVIVFPEKKMGGIVSAFRNIILNFLTWRSINDLLCRSDQKACARIATSAGEVLHGSLATVSQHLTSMISKGSECKTDVTITLKCAETTCKLLK